MTSRESTGVRRFVMLFQRDNNVETMPVNAVLAIDHDEHVAALLAELAQCKSELAASARVASIMTGAAGDHAEEVERLKAELARVRAAADILDGIYSEVREYLMADSSDQPTDLLDDMRMAVDAYRATQPSSGKDAQSGPSE